MYIALLGRQPAISLAELERVYGSVEKYSPETAMVQTQSIDIERLGGTQKAGAVILELPLMDWRQTSLKIINHYSQAWHKHEGKITLGISAYGFDVSPRDVQKTGLVLKAKLKTAGLSLRLVPNQTAALSTATSHHNKLGLADNKIELLVVRGNRGVVVAESSGAQNITALAARDQGRPRRDAFVGMLPPKLAQIMINLAGPLKAATNPNLKQARILDPFCGTGVILQEALLMGYAAYGSDLSEKMVNYSRDNLNWLEKSYNFHGNWYLHQGDAMETSWQPPIDAVVSETYLGQPFSAVPSPSKLAEVRNNCNHIIGQFLKNLATQLPSGTPVVIAVPAWKDSEGAFTHLPLTNELESLGYTPVSFRSVVAEELLYFRSNQVVARELLVMIKD